jgi:hypothetical protein
VARELVARGRCVCVSIKPDGDDDKSDAMRCEYDAILSRCPLRRENRQAQLGPSRLQRAIRVLRAECGMCELQPGTDHADSRFTKRLACSWIQGLREGSNGDATAVQREESTNEPSNERT